MAAAIDDRTDTDTTVGRNKEVEGGRGKMNREKRK